MPWRFDVISSCCLITFYCKNSGKNLKIQIGFTCALPREKVVMAAVGKQANGSLLLSSSSGGGSSDFSSGSDNSPTAGEVTSSSAAVAAAVRSSSSSPSCNGATRGGGGGGGRSVEWVGTSCGQHGPYTFYKAAKVNSHQRKRILALGDFFLVKLWADQEIVAIGEIQLLWTDCYQSPDSPLASLKLYFLPENTPDGRHEEHGEVSEREKQKTNERK